MDQKSRVVSGELTVLFQPGREAKSASAWRDGDVLAGIPLTQWTIPDADMASGKRFTVTRADRADVKLVIKGQAMCRVWNMWVALTPRPTLMYVNGRLCRFDGPTPPSGIPTVCAEDDGYFETQLDAQDGVTLVLTSFRSEGFL